MIYGKNRIKIYFGSVNTTMYTVYGKNRIKIYFGSVNTTMYNDLW